MKRHRRGRHAQPAQPVEHRGGVHRRLSAQTKLGKVLRMVVLPVTLFIATVLLIAAAMAILVIVYDAVSLKG